MGLQLDSELKSIQDQIETLEDAKAACLRLRKELIQKKKLHSRHKIPSTVVEVDRKKSSSAGNVNYFDSSAFKWTKELMKILRNYFGITKLRLCQEGVLNAVMDGRDVVCIMPTGGGKSACFQAPAILSRGTTLVISPLLSLMADQVMHLKEKGVEAVM